MLLGRNIELKQLAEGYEADGNKAIVLYGRVGIGKTTLANAFAKGHPFVYYSARELSEREQLLCFTQEMGMSADVTDAGFSYYRAIKQAAERNKDTKTIFIIDEFQYMMNNDEGFKNAFVLALRDEELSGKLMFLLLSSSVNWVENSMVVKLKAAAKGLSGIIKLRELSFMETINRFKNQSVEKTIYAGAILGGVPGLLDYWSEKQDVKDNIIRLFLSKRGPLRNEAERFLKAELRELPAYNAILATLAKGEWKLNDIYQRTGFQRAKISVYLKNLIELDVVEKVFSFEAGDHESIRKGMYCIKDNYLCFWYRYVFPNLSMLDAGMEKEVYDNIIAFDLDNYMRERYADVCFEYTKLMSEYGKLSNTYTKWGKWYGKAGDIDIIASNEEGNVLVGFVSFSKKSITSADIKKYKSIMKAANIQKAETFVFARNGFENDAKVTSTYEKIKLINMDEL